MVMEAPETFFFLESLQKSLNKQRIFLQTNANRQGTVRSVPKEESAAGKLRDEFNGG